MKDDLKGKWKTRGNFTVVVVGYWEPDNRWYGYIEFANGEKNLVSWDEHANNHYSSLYDLTEKFPEETHYPPKRKTTPEKVEFPTSLKE